MSGNRPPGAVFAGIAIEKVPASTYCGWLVFPPATDELPSQKTGASTNSMNSLLPLNTLAASVGRTNTGGINR